MKKLYFLAFFLTATPATVTKQTVSTVWGQEEMDHPLLEQLLASPAMERIKKIDQSGPPAYFGYTPPFSRYDHCVGVWALLKHAGVTLEEQSAGLLHDASHTVFSHLADMLFCHDTRTHACSYQDSIHEWFLEKMDIPKLTLPYEIPLAMLNPDNENYAALERPLPHLCADRIQYNIHTGVIFKVISNKEAQEIVHDLQFKNGVWFFTSVPTAKKFAKLPLLFTKQLWGSPYNHIFYQFFSEILRQSFSDKLFTKEDFHFGTDQALLEKIQASSNHIIQTLLKKCTDIFAQFTVVPYGKGTYNHKPKCSGIDPLVMTRQGVKRLREIDPEFDQEFKEVQDWCTAGYGILCCTK